MAGLFSFTLEDSKKMQVEEKFIQEDLNTGVGTEGSLLIPKKIFDTLWPDYEKAVLSRELCAINIGPAGIPGSSVDVDLEAADAMDVRTIGEGAEIPKETPSYTSLNLKPIKYGARINITREMVEDSKFPLLQRGIALLGRRFAENETSLMITQLDSAANTVSGGSAITIANITRAMQHLEDADAMPTDYVVGYEVVNDLRNIDTFFEADKSGGVNARTDNMLGTIYGMRVHVASTNAGMTKTSSYVLDRNHALACAEKRPVTTEAYRIETHDTEGVAVTQRIAFKIMRTTAVAKITTS